MATQLFSDILQNTADPTRATNNATMWLREQAQNVRAGAINNPKQLLSKQTDRLVPNVTVGRMYLFMYDPKMKEDLPYYDRFPLIFPFLSLIHI